MPAVRVPAILVVDPRTGLPLAEARGAVGTIVAEGTNTPLTLSHDKAGTNPIAQPITITPGGYIPQHWNQEGLRGTFVPLSGTWSTPVWSPQGLEEAAASSAADAEASRIAAELAAKPIVAGANVTVTEVDGSLVVASTASGTGGASSIDELGGVTTVGKAVAKAADDTAARQAIGAGTSNVVAAWTATGLPNGTPVAAPAGTAFRKDGTTKQVVAAPVQFDGDLTVKPGALTQEAIVGLIARLAELEARGIPVVVQNQGDDPIAAGGRPGDVVFFVNAATGGGPTDPPPPVNDTTSLRHRFLIGVPDGAALPNAGGTGDTPITTQAGSPTVVVIDGIPRARVNGSIVQTWRDNPSTASPAGDLPALGVFSVDVLLRIAAYPASPATFMVGSGAFQLSISVTGGITVLTSAGAAAPSTVGGGAAGASNALALNTDYHVKVWRPSTAANALSQFAVYAADNTTVVWPTTGTPANRDIGVANMTAWIRGKTGAIAGDWSLGQERLDDVGVALAAL